MSRVFLGLGSNIGNSREEIERAVSFIGEKYRIVKRASLYSAEPVGFIEQDWFVNSVIEVSCDDTCDALMAYILSVEKRMGRVRTVKNGPRCIDIDMLVFGDMVVKKDGICIPHPRMHERLFVLKPFSEIAPDVVHPVFQKTISELYEMCEDTSRVTRIED